MSAEMPVTLAHHGGVHHGTNGVITRIVIHDEEYPVGVDSAESVAHYFSGPTHGDSCAHYVVDADSIQHPARDDELCYHAPPNTGSIGIEHDGYARFTTADWAKPGSVATLRRSAVLTASLCQRHGIPVVFLSVDDLRAGKRGITTHRNVSAAWGLSTHTDPGTSFPIDNYIAAVQAALSPTPVTPIPEDDGMIIYRQTFGSHWWFQLVAGKLLTVISSQYTASGAAVTFVDIGPDQWARLVKITGAPVA